MKFKVGDRVKVIKANISQKAAYVGRTAIIKAVNPNGNRHVDSFGEHYSLDIGAFFVFYANELAAMVNKIVITTDGKETLARLYDGDKVLKSATAKCSPDDTLDFQTGAKLAFERLFAEEKKEEKKEERRKFVLGKMYKYKGLLGKDGGVIKITGYKDHNYTFEIVKGMTEWGNVEKKFGDISAMAMLYIEEATPEDLKIEVGERVKVVNNGKSYTTHKDWIEKNAPEMAIYYAYNILPRNGAYGVVIKIADGICAIAIKGNHDYESIYLVNLDGIERA